MRTAKIGVLRNQLSAYLRHVRNGEEVVIYDRNVPIATISPIDPSRDRDTEKAELIAAGILKPPVDPTPMDWDAFWALPRPTVSDEAVREAIEWAKGDR
jgi:antitoxin (DNA-binding transcriptional repressor) of toxin-antitoxin stability system